MVADSGIAGVNEDDETVVVRAVRKKPPHATTEDIL